MIIGIQDEILRLNALGLLEPLLKDKTTKTNILWATDAYQRMGPDYQRNGEIRPELITGQNSGVIKNRARKALEQQSERTRQHAEVFTPLWICKKMNDFADESWFKKRDPHPFDRPEPVRFLSKTRWWRYVDARRMEITCGEAPYLVSRYDVSTGESIPIENRIGILDRKLRVVGENTSTEEEWLRWALRAYQATYGYEFQGDNVLIARVNLLMTFEEYLYDRWKRKPTPKERQEVLNVIVWNIWQMDGLTGAIPYCRAEEVGQQIMLADWLEEEYPQTALADWLEPDEMEPPKPQPHCRVYDWRSKKNMEFLSLSERGNKAMKFNFVIGNPPYQDETIGENRTFAPPIYHKFLEGAYQVSDKVEMIHPARFLFDAGSTPKDWNRKMLQDPHLKVLYYTAKSSDVFNNTDIKGGVAITYHDNNTDFGAIEHFVVFDELRSIKQKVSEKGEESLSSIIFASESYKFNDLMHTEHPEAEEKLSKGHKYDFKTSVLEKLDGSVFFSERPVSGEYVQILGLVKAKRVTKWIKREYIKEPTNFEYYKVFVPAANGSGALGEVLSTPVIGQPVIGHTQTFISIGCFETEFEANALLKYVKSKFARTMLGILKITQHNPAPKWKYVPLQDFTPTSDIDWSKSIPEIDQQLYAKYGLDEQEIAFIESHVKEMS
ncbi:MAG: Eco57I restriction-modification methylase domain-containing protein [Clostridiales bacterium]|nr:Eco57I restriction-modification methylase domain-containing protein [Clostridiales bacterium]